MTKIKTFEYTITDYNSKSTNIRFINEEINDFIKDKNVIDIKVNTIDIRYPLDHRCSNIIGLVYTIIYTI